jgi:nicotinate-nucleotide adenylyltransferase
MAKKSKNIGLFFGTFNPVHVGHFIIANYIRQEKKLDEIWFVVTPHNPLKVKADLLPDYHRLNILKEAIDEVSYFKASDVEFKLPQPNYTIDTLTYLSEMYPSINFYLIIGEDNLRTFHRWKNYEEILLNYSVLVYPREVQMTERNEKSQLNQKLATYDAAIQFTTAPVIGISSSMIRKMIKEGKDVRFLLTKEVHEFIDKMNFYR